MAKNEVVVNAPHDYEDIIADGMPDTNPLHKVVSCDVDDDKGILEYDRVNFPAVGAGPVSSIPWVDPSRPPLIQHLKDMRVIGTDVIMEIRKRGVKVIVLNS